MRGPLLRSYQRSVVARPCCGKLCVSNNSSIRMAGAVTLFRRVCRIRPRPIPAPHRPFSSSRSQSSTNVDAITSLQSSNGRPNDVIIVGAGIAGICTARYLLRQSPNIKIRIVDRHDGIAMGTSRINGGLLCPSLSNSWTSYPIVLGKHSMLSMAWERFRGGGKRDEDTAASLLTFDPKLLLDRRLWNFALHWLRRKPYLHAQNDVIGAIMHSSMACYNDESDDIIQSVRYDRTAKGTRTNDGNFGELDSSGDIHLFCTGLYEKLVETYGEKIQFHGNMAVDSFTVDDGRIQSVKLVDSRQNGAHTWTADQFVIAAGNESYDLCRKLQVQCPVFPVKGYIVVFHSDVVIPHNLELPNKSYVSPLGEGKYHLSGFAEFTSYNTINAMDVDMNRAEALIAAAKVNFPDMKVDSVHVGYRPLMPDDTPSIGKTSKYNNLFLNAGAGSKGWSMGPGSGKLLADIMLHLDSDVDPAPYSPERFEVGWT